MCVKSVAEGGASMTKVTKQLEDFAAANTDVVVDKLLVSVGTNDIRHCRSGVNHLRGPLKTLCGKIKELYPNAHVYFQSLLPLPCDNMHDWNTNANVIHFNRILFSECVFRKFFFVDAFESFNIPWNGWSPYIRNDVLFEKGGIHPSINKGMGVLARLYIRAIHSKFFNPHVFQ